MEIPEDLVIEILTKLPVKSVLRFKCVCKHWYTLIQNPNFITRHYYHDNNTTHLLVQHITDRANYNGPNTVFTLFQDEQLTTSQDLDYPDSLALLNVVAGPVNGLFLLQDVSLSRCIWNPATRESRPLSQLNPNFSRQIIPWKGAMGFGVDPVTNNYNLIVIEFCRNENVPSNTASYVTFVAVYDLVTDSWNRLDAKIPSSLYFKNSSLCLRGHHYWLSDYTSRPAIIAYDMSNNVFREIKVPPGSVISSRLSIFSDNVALFTRSLLTYDFWVMEVEGYWTKSFSVENLPHRLCCPLKLWKDNEIFLPDKSRQLVLYNIGTRESRNLGVQESPFGDTFRYKESLISVKSESKKSELRGSGLYGTIIDFFIVEALPIWIWLKSLGKVRRWKK